MLLFEPPPSRVIVRLGAGVMLNMNALETGLMWYDGIEALLRSSSCHPLNSSDALMVPRGSVSLMSIENS